MTRSSDSNRKPMFGRRAFLKGSGAAMAVTAAATVATTAEAQDKPSAAIISGETEITLNVNGKDHAVKVEPQMTLLDVLRNKLNLTGCKEVEDTTVAGADTVIIDGKATMAATRLVLECVGRKILTSESMVDDEIVAGFVKHDALQCGYCTPGFVMATRAFLNKNPRASLAEIQKGLGGNICRCGTYQGITQCALEIAQKGGA